MATNSVLRVLGSRRFGDDKADARAASFLDDTDALLFDLCGVIYDDTIWTRWLCQLVSRMGLPLTFDAFCHRWRREYLPPVERGQRDYWDALRMFLQAAGFRRGQIDEICAAGHARQREFEEGIQPLPGVRSVVSQLAAQGWKLGVLARAPWNCQGVQDRLWRLGLLHAFPVAVGMLDLKAEGACESPYDLAAARFAVPAAKIAWVSEDRCHVEEALLHGLCAVGLQVQVSLPRCVTIDHLGELLTIATRRQTTAVAA